MLDLEKYGVADRWPKLRRLRGEVAQLEKRRGEAEGEVMAARNAIPTARERDAEAAGKAVRAGKSVPEAIHEAEALAALQDAERTLGAYQKALEGATSDLAAFTAKHRSQLHADISGALRDKAQRLREHATEAARLYATIEDSKYDLRELAPPPAPDESAPARDSFTVLGIYNTQSGGPNRGDVESMIAYLAGLEAQFAEGREDDAA